MDVLKANQEQFSNLEGFSNGNSYIKFTQDANDNYIIGKEVLTDNLFLEIRNQLEELEVINYNPKKTEL
jgi:hypothetical protein